MVREYKRKTKSYRGFTITLEYYPRDWVGIPAGWVFNLYDEDKDYGYNWGVRLPFNKALKDAKRWADELRSGTGSLEERMQKKVGFK